MRSEILELLKMKRCSSSQVDGGWVFILTRTSQFDISNKVLCQCVAAAGMHLLYKNCGAKLLHANSNVFSSGFPNHACHIHENKY